MAFDLADYNTVAERIAEFREKHPDGSLQPANPERPWEVLAIGGQTFVCFAAAAYRTADDPRPGIGVAWEPVPGTTPYTKNSELQNAETSAWGRAIVAALAGDAKKGIATQDEIRNRRAETDPEQHIPAGSGAVRLCALCDTSLLGHKVKPSPDGPIHADGCPVGEAA